MREKLIDIVEAYADFLDWDTKEDMVDSIMDAFATDNNVGSKWISVKDRLPEKKGTFLVCTKNDFYGTKNIAKVRFYDGEWHGTGGIWSNVTHWMPLPAPPKGE